VECGTPLARVIDWFGGGSARPTKAMVLGGTPSGIVPVHKINELGIELFFAFKVRQAFVRLHVGDLHAAGMIHFSMRALFDWPARHVAMGALLLAFAIVGLQAVGLITP